MPRRTVEARFWSKVDVRGPDECWMWLARVNEDGYGEFWLGECTRAHCIAYMLTYGLIPEGMCVLHKCDIPGCCNPIHLWLGTHLDNMRDKGNKGREAVGERRPMSKLTGADIRLIRGSGDSKRSLARRFGVSPSTIWNIRAGLKWRHVT